MWIFKIKNLIKIFLLLAFVFSIFLISFKEKIFPIHKIVCRIEQSSIFYNKQIFSFKPISNLFFNYCYDVLGTTEETHVTENQKKPKKGARRSSRNLRETFQAQHSYRESRRALKALPRR